ncbi:MAG: hypothetical protein KDJ29_02955, partial [Hyphomicrobiales bacterium]|nr:hypothetical protein [Hyphomicrobiales bacterium]
MNTFPLTRAALVRPAIASALLVSAVFALCLTAAGAGAQTQPQASTNSSQAGAGDVAVKPGQTGGAGRYVMTPAANG